MDPELRNLSLVHAVDFFSQAGAGDKKPTATRPLRRFVDEPLLHVRLPRRRTCRFSCDSHECHSCCTNSTFPTWYAPVRCSTSVNTLPVAVVHLSGLQTPK